MALLALKLWREFDGYSWGLSLGSFVTIEGFSPNRAEALRQAFAAAERGLAEQDAEEEARRKRHEDEILGRRYIT